MGRPQGRPKSGQEALTRERILAKALSLVDRKGLESLSMRNLAESLGVDPMAIYHHLPGKRALIKALIEKVLGGLSVPILARSSWKARVRAYARSYRELARAHPGLVLHLVSDSESASGAAMAAGESLYAALAGARLGPIQTVRSGDLVVDYLNGVALSEMKGALEDQGARGSFRAMLGKEGRGRYPAMERTYSSLPSRIPQTGFDSGLEIILLGIGALSARGAG